MKRRKRKMGLALMGQLEGVASICRDGQRNHSSGSLFALTVLCVAILQAAHLVNPTTQINGATGNNQTAVNHFDDEPNFRLEFVNLKRLQASPSLAAPQMISNSQNEASQARQLTIVKLQDQPDQAGSESDTSNQHLDDLLAVESGRSPVAVGQSQLKHQAQSGFVAPYEASGVLPRFQNLSSTPSIPKHHQKDNTQNSANQSTQLISDNSDGGPTQLLRLQPHAPLEPIYLKHNLPDHHAQPSLKRQGQIVAFPHPSHTVAPNGGFAGAQPQGSYALLPSWPNIYIAQRERTLAPVASTPTPSPPTPHRDPKVPSDYPEWSLSRARQRERENEASRQYSAHQVAEEARKRTNLTASEVEYSKEGEGEEDRESYRKSERKSMLTRQRAEDEIDENNNNNKTTASADGAQWARLLHQAVASKHPIKPLMFTNRSIISLFCDTHDMLVSLKFKQPFYGFVETNLDPLRQCRIFGNGSHLYEMRISLLDCGTRQEMPRLFINNIHIQFRSNNSKEQQHHNEEASRARLSSTERLQPVDSQTDDDGPHDDELKTLVCSYPPPPPPQPVQHLAGDGSEPASNSHVTAESDNLNIASDLTQPTRPYSIAFNGGRGARGRANGTHDNATGGSGLAINNNRDEFGRPLRPSDRIIDITSVDDPTSARPAYYEPILLISGLLLLAIACTLALISSAYLARRRAQQRPRSASSSSNRLPPSSGAAPFSDNRVHRISPSQLANRSGGSPLYRSGLASPPLIGLTKEELLTKRPSGKKYSTIGQKQARAGSAKSPSGANTNHKLIGGSISKRRSRLDATTAVHENLTSQTSDGTSDSLASSGARRSRTESSASTIEIPPASAGVAAKMVHGHRAAGSRRGGERPKTPVGSTAEEPPVAATRDEYRREVSHERIVEKTTSYSRRSARSTPESPPTRDKTPPSDKQVRLKQELQPEKKSSSPLPFGSFRSKLTSPDEYVRLQNISKLFGDSLAPARDNELHLRCRNRIARTMSDRERLDMRKLFQHDEVFKSNVVDSIDAETFGRKLRDNPRYTGKLSPAAWSLLQEIVLSPDMARPPGAGSSRLPRVGSTELGEIFSSAASPAPGARGETPRANPSEKSPARVHPRGQPKVTNLDEGKLWPAHERENAGKLSPVTSQSTPSKPLLGLQLAKKEVSEPRAATSTQKADRAAATFKPDPGDNRLTAHGDTKKMVSDRDHDDQPTVATKSTGVRISQSNSARTRRDDSRTMINIDSVTNISAPRNFSAFTRSSFEQVTRYQEEDSLPYMDELSTQSSLDQDQRSFSSSSLGGGTTSKSKRVQ